MSKETPILAARAKDLYIKKPLTIKGIAERLGVSERTVRIWKKKDGNWERERQAYIDSRTSFHEDLYDLCHEIMGYISAEFRARRKIDPSCLKAFHEMLPYVLKPKDYEAVQLKRQEKKKSNSNQDVALSILSAMGILDDVPGDDEEFDDEIEGEDTSDGDDNSEAAFLSILPALGLPAVPPDNLDDEGPADG